MKPVAIALLVVLAAALLVAMRLGWQRRGARTAAVIPTMPVVPDDPGTPRQEPVPGTYVSTTFATSWLDRVVAHGLGVRSTVDVEVYDAGLVLRRGGAPDVFVPAGAVREVGTANGIAGKVVGGGRLVVVTWQLGETLVTTGVLPRHAADRDVLVAAVTDLTQTDAAEEQR